MISLPSYVTAYAAGVVRHAVTTAAGALVADGVMTNSDANTAVGAVMALVGVAWSAYNKRSQRIALANATAPVAAIPAPAPVEGTPNA